MISPSGVTRFWSGIARSAKLYSTSQGEQHVASRRACEVEDRAADLRIAHVTIDNAAKLNCLRRR